MIQCTRFIPRPIGLAFEAYMHVFSLYIAVPLALLIGSSHASLRDASDILRPSVVPEPDRLDAKLVHRKDTSLGRVVEYELDRYGILIKISVAMSLVILIIGAVAVTSLAVSNCAESVRRRKRIRDWEASKKGISSPRKYTQSIGEDYIDVADLETDASSLPPPYLQL